MKKLMKTGIVRKTAMSAVLLAAGLSVSLRGAEGRELPAAGIVAPGESRGTEPAAGGEEAGPEAEESGFPEVREETYPADPVVYVCGAVREPDVYTCAEGGRIADAVELAGGLTEDAAPWLMNLADPLYDGMKIYVPRTGEAEAYPYPGAENTGGGASVSGRAAGSGAKAAEESGGTVDINRASKEELVTLPGIGETRAESIIRYREAHGGFRTPEDIMKVPGIKEKAYEKLKEKIRAD